ncbi:MAG TPA: Npt1/Npt2 family nucleotide transporter [Polyangia bacterium]|nr:Npt1/Npt2 family nucleotide transporter [Polyangia bacterium]
MSIRSRVAHALAAIFRPFTKVHPDEAATVGLMTLTAFLILTAYYLLKTVREPLILLQGGAEVKLYARAGQTVLMVGVVHVYGELARRVGRIKLLSIVFLFFISNLALFAFMARANVPIGLPFFLWVGVFSYTVIAQFWALAADIYSDEQGKRLFPIIGAGSSIGAVLGGLFAKSLVPFGAPVSMGTAVIILLACVALIIAIERRARVYAVRHDEAHPDEPIAEEAAWRLLARDKYLWFIAGMVILLNWCNSSGEYLLDRTLLVATRDAAAHGASSQAFIGSFKADYYFWYNLIGVTLQLLAVSRILRIVGVRAALFVMPTFALAAYGTAVFRPVLGVMRIVKIGENSLQYSLQDTTRHALFLVTSRVEKFVGKTAVDTIAVRLGAVMAATTVYVGTRAGWATSTFATINVALALGWMGFVVLIGREHRRRSDVVIE